MDYLQEFRALLPVLRHLPGLRHELGLQFQHCQVIFVEGTDLLLKVADVRGGKRQPEFQLLDI